MEYLYVPFWNLRRAKSLLPLRFGSRLVDFDFIKSTLQSVYSVNSHQLIINHAGRYGRRGYYVAVTQVVNLSRER